MRERLKNNYGFTLAELLAAVAIIGILVVISIPSIVSMQEKLRMTELDNAAQSIAAAAQSQMTDKKTSGTWLDLIEKYTKDDSQKAKALPAGVNEDDIYYLTAAQAKQSGILPRNSIDDTIYNGDFIIEYSKSTATVCGVFFSDGKTGVFDEAPASTDAAKAYYDGLGSKEDRSKDARMAASSLVGYYWGTPAGATKTVALKKPAIWMSEETGFLCVQNQNLNDESLNTSLSIKITKLDNEGNDTDFNFIISGLQAMSGSPSYTYYLTTQDRIDKGLTGYGVVLDDEIRLFSREALGDTDSFEIDLNRILDIILASGDGNEDLIAMAQQFSPSDPIRIVAEATTKQKPCIPAEATAFAEWPDVEALITLLVTDPNYEKVKPSHVTGTYTAPVVKLTQANGSDPASGNDTPSVYEKSLVQTIENTSNTLVAENLEAGHQAYSGGSVVLSRASEIDAFIQADVGSYESSEANHQYQIFEIWLNDSKIGYLKDNKWIWTEAGKDVAHCLVDDTFEYPEVGPVSEWDTKDITSVRLYTEAFEDLIEAGVLADAGIAPDEKDGYTFIIRTTPRIDEVEAFVDIYENKTRFAMFSNEANGAISSRSTFFSATDARLLFEEEFGASSSVASWTSVISGDSGTSDIEDFPAGLKFYYAGTPALGMNADSSEKTNRLENAALWFYSGSNFDKQDQAMVQYHREGDGLSDLYLKPSSNADFEIPHQQDSLFCRVLFYFDKDENRLSGYDPQYVPHSVQSKTYLQNGASASSIFACWSTEDSYTSMPEGQKLACSQGSAVGAEFYSAYGNKTLAWGRVDLEVTEASIGMVYFENYSDGTSGYFGYADARFSSIDINSGMDESNEKVINSWGYYAIIPTELASTNIKPQSGGVTLSEAGVSITHPSTGISYTCFSLGSAVSKAGNPYVKSTFTLSGISANDFSADYYLNLNFAKAVQTNKNMADQWGVRSGDQPFIVRHIDQFIGCLNTGVRDSFLSNYFKQEHDITFTNSLTQLAYSNNAFSGIYDGNNYLIQGYRPADHRKTSYTYNEATSSINYGKESGPYYIGLFCQTNNAEIRNVSLAGIKNVTVSVDFKGNGTQRVSFGYLAGNASNTTFKNCHIVGSGIDATYFNLNGDIGGSVKYHPFIGGITGVSNASTLKDCSVSNLKLRGDSPESGSSVARYSIGGLIGHCSSGTTKIEWSGGKLQVEKVSIGCNIRDDGWRPINKPGVGALVGTKMLLSAGIDWPNNPRSSYSNVINSYDNTSVNDYLGRSDRTDE